MVLESQDFARDVIAASYERPVVVDFWAPWCGPCRMLGPVLERLEADAGGRWRLVKLNTDVHPKVAMEHAISSIPAVKMFVDGSAVADFVGAQPEAMVAMWLRQHLPAPKNDQVEAGKAALGRGARDEARRLFEEAIAATAEQYEARHRLAELVLEENAQRALELLEPVPEEYDAYDEVEALRTLARLSELRRQPPPSPDGNTAEAWKRYQKGATALFSGDYATAAEEWIGVARAHRKLDDDGARRAAVALFRYLGDDHEVTAAYRPALAAVLY